MLDLDLELGALLASVEDIRSPLCDPGSGPGQDIGKRLDDSVARPLRHALASTGDRPGETNQAQPGARVPAPAGDVGAEIWELAQLATRLRLGFPNVPGLAEAVAALQDLAVGLAGEATAGDRRKLLAELQSGMDPRIQLAPNGPYLVTNATRVTDWLGQELPTLPTLALCRCGGSAIKPLCDGTHATNGFTDGKDPGRVPDRQETYVGQQVNVLDNRGTCQHSGFCTDRLTTVFHAGEEPFVTPSGGRMDEIIRAVRDCPSGALSYAIDDSEARDEVDLHGRREPAIEVTRDGPYRVTGGIALVEADGVDVARNVGASREHYALCRCGHSQNKPFCSGMHYYVQFRDPVRAGDHEPTMFEWSGGLPALTRMTRLFYEKHVPADPLLAPLFATMSADHPQRVAKWLAEVFGGPKRYSAEHGGYPRMLSQHIGKCLTEQQRTRWAALLQQSALEAGLPNDAEFRSAFGAYIEWGSRLAVENSQTSARPPEHMPMPHWDWHTAAGPPGSRVSAFAPPPEKEEQVLVSLPGPGEQVSFAKHVKPLFRSADRQSMSFAFDLWEYADVSAHADAILQRLEAGSMPCDGAWPAERITVFHDWIAAGRPE